MFVPLFLSIAAAYAAISTAGKPAKEKADEARNHCRGSDYSGNNGGGESRRGGSEDRNAELIPATATVSEPAPKPASKKAGEAATDLPVPEVNEKPAATGQAGSHENGGK